MNMRLKLEDRPEPTAKELWEKMVEILGEFPYDTVMSAGQEGYRWSQTEAEVLVNFANTVYTIGHGTISECCGKYKAPKGVEPQEWGL